MSISCGNSALSLRVCIKSMPESSGISISVMIMSGSCLTARLNAFAPSSASKSSVIPMLCQSMVSRSLFRSQGSSSTINSLYIAIPPNRSSLIPVFRRFISSMQTYNSLCIFTVKAVKPNSRRLAIL